MEYAKENIDGPMNARDKLEASLKASELCNEDISMWLYNEPSQKYPDAKPPHVRAQLIARCRSVVHEPGGITILVIGQMVIRTKDDHKCPIKEGDQVCLCLDAPTLLFAIL